jgi:hypothetical protein
MGENWYAVQQEAHDRITEARAAARSRALIRDLAPRNRGRYTVGIGLIRLGSWVLASGMSLPTELSSTLAALRAATNRALRI